MPKTTLTGTLEALQMSRNTSLASDDLLVKRGNQLHIIILWIVVFFGIAYGFLDYLQGNMDQALMNVSVTPIAIFCFWLFKNGYINISKIINLLGVTVRFIMV